MIGTCGDGGIPVPQRPALLAGAGVVEGVQVAGVAERDRSHADAHPRLVHHVEHVGQSAVLLADQVPDRTGITAGQVLALAEVQQRVRRAAVPHLVVQPGQHDVVALAGVDEVLGHDEQRQALHPGRRTGHPRQHEMDDVLGQLVVAAGDPHLVPEQPVAAVGLRFGAHGHIGQRGAGLWLRQAHGPVEPALQHGAHVGVDLLLAAVGQQQVRVADGQERVPGGADVRGLEPGEAGHGHDRRQLHAADLGRHPGGHQARFVEHLERRCDLGMQVDALAVERGLLGVIALVVRSEVPLGHGCAEVQRRVESLPGVLRVPFPRREGLDVQPLVEQELEVALGQDEAAGHGATVGGAWLWPSRPHECCVVAVDPARLLHGCWFGGPQTSNGATLGRRSQQQRNIRAVPLTTTAGPTPSPHEAYCLRGDCPTRV